MSSQPISYSEYFNAIMQEIYEEICILVPDLWSNIITI